MAESKEAKKCDHPTTAVYLDECKHVRSSVDQVGQVIPMTESETMRKSGHLASVLCPVSLKF